MREEREVRFRWRYFRFERGVVGERKALRRVWIAGGEFGGQEGGGRPSGLAERRRVVRVGWVSKEVMKSGGRWVRELLVRSRVRRLGR